MKRTVSRLALLALTAGGAPAWASATEREGVYGFAGAGSTFLEVEYSTAASTRTTNASATHFNAGVGYRWGRHVGIEVGASSTQGGARIGELGSVSGRGMNVAVLGIAPLGKRLELLGKVSVGAERLRWSAGSAQPRTVRTTTGCLCLGIGARYWLKDAVAVRLDVDALGGMAFRDGDNRGTLDPGTATLGFQYSF